MVFHIRYNFVGGLGKYEESPLRVPNIEKPPKGSWLGDDKYIPNIGEVNLSSNFNHATTYYLKTNYSMDTIMHNGGNHHHNEKKVTYQSQGNDLLPDNSIAHS